MRRRRISGEQSAKAVTVSIYMDSVLESQVEELAAKVGVSKSQMICNLVAIGYEDAKLLDAIGIFALVHKIDQLRKGTYGMGEQLQPA